jgi:hypothetical protein
LLCRKLSVLEEILSLSQTQAALVERDDVDGLMEALAAKQTHLDRLRVLQNELAPYRDEDPEARLWRTPQRRRQTQIVARRCEEVLEAIMAIEKECERQLLQRRAETAAELQSVDAAQRARDEYASSLAVPRGGSEILADA